MTEPATLARMAGQPRKYDWTNILTSVRPRISRDARAAKLSCNPLSHCLTSMKCFCIGLAGAAMAAGSGQAQTVSNSVVSLSVDQSHGGAITSFKVLGTETINGADLGRDIQSSFFFDSAGLPPQAAGCVTAVPPWLNPQEAGDECGIPSQIYAIGTTGNRLDVGVYPRDWHGRGITPGLRIEGHHTVGPLPYISDPETTQLKYQVYWDQAYAGQPDLKFQHSTFDARPRATPVPFVPAAYFKADLLPRLYGLSLDGTTWIELTSSVSASGGDYEPSLYRFRAMAWMQAELGWGVALYGRSTLEQSCGANAFEMALAAQSGQCPNFAAQRFPSQGTNNLSVVVQGLRDQPPGTGVEIISHMVVGNLTTIQDQVNRIYQSGN